MTRLVEEGQTGRRFQLAGPSAGTLLGLRCELATRLT